MSATLIVMTISAGVVVGVLAALFGVGGGLLMVPFMVLVLEKTQHVAEGTSLAVIVPTAIVAVIAHSRRGYVSMRSAALLALGGVGGAVVGAKMALALPASTLELIFGLVVIAIGVRFIQQGASRGRAEDPR